MPVVNNRFTRKQNERRKPTQWESYPYEDQAKWHLKRIKRLFKVFISNAHVEINDKSERYRCVNMNTLDGSPIGETEYNLMTLPVMEMYLYDAIDKIVDREDYDKAKSKADSTLERLKTELVEKINKDDKLLNDERIMKAFERWINHNTTWPKKVEMING